MIIHYTNLTEHPYPYVLLNDQDRGCSIHAEDGLAWPMDSLWPGPGPVGVLAHIYPSVDIHGAHLHRQQADIHAEQLAKTGNFVR